MPPKAQGGTRKLSKEEREKLRRLEQERRQREAEEARIREEEEEAARQERERVEALLRAEAVKEQQRQRVVQLTATAAVTTHLDTTMELTRDRIKDQEEWERMMRCDGLPDPTSVPEMNRYLSLWRADLDTATLEGALAKTHQVIHVISELEAVMEDTGEATEKQLRDWREIWLELQEAQKEKLDQATYHQLLDLRPHLDHETMVYSFFTSSPLVSLALWSNTTRSPKNNCHEVKELGFTFTLPEDLVEAECVVRVMRTEYDHYSKFAPTFNTPNVQETHATLLEDCGEEVEAAPEEQLPAKESELSSDTFAPSPHTHLPACCTPRVAGGGGGGKAEGDGKEKMGAPPVLVKKYRPPHFTETGPGELNLRRYRIQGGVYTIDLLEVPPQPRVLADCTITQVEEVCTVSRVHWVANYNPPAAPEAAGQRRRDPEAVEQEMRQLEKELQKLILITIKLPDSAFWFEPPQMVLWDERKRCWSNEYFHDVKYNEDQCVMQVRTTRLGVMGLAMNRFANLPFQSWELKPQGGTAVSLTLIAAVVVAEFTIMEEGHVCLANLQDGARTALSHLYGKPMKANALIKTLQFYGINLFPDRDSYCYIDGLPTKHRPTEQHLYRCMALVAPAVHFAWSRWNLLAGLTKLVFQMKTKKISPDDTQVGQPLVLVTPQKTCVLECTEISQAFSNNDEDPSKYYADLYQLVLDDLDEGVRQTVQDASPIFIHNIQYMLKAASVISYC
ncbi:dynein axonemal intermediate chain 7-like [Homarus americanus]|uniref:dynein axonemal intermediate chain 7-like n=1 Tax=Homarus americanus TaxID=6706 RepID=UPI001C4387A6|nr:dynein axonemal intermediate chain 7-like [Homarus americanus]